MTRGDLRSYPVARSGDRATTGPLALRAIAVVGWLRPRLVLVTPMGRTLPLFLRVIVVWRLRRRILLDWLGIHTGNNERRDGKNRENAQLHEGDPRRDMLNIECSPLGCHRSANHKAHEKRDR